MINIKTKSPEETSEIAESLGMILSKDDLICLTGDLGSGKTLFTKGIANTLGIKEYITSPTFTVVNEYDSEPPLFHFDVYRLADPDEILDIGFEEYLNRGGVTIIEWADLIKSILPNSYIWISINKDNLEARDSRNIIIEFHGRKYEKYEELFKNKLSGY